MKNRVRIVVAYLGTPFLGWQRQSEGPTVQGTLEEACSRVVGKLDITVVGSGRTDAGVHASGQVAHIDFPVAIPPSGLVKALNNTLPDSIRVLRASTVTETFHARYSATSKRYVYRLRWAEGAQYRPWQVMRTAIVSRPQDEEMMHSLVESLPGFRDWGSFTVANPETPTTTRTLFRAQMRRRRTGLELEFIGEGFLRYQVRRMVGALLQVGQGFRDTAWFLDLVANPSPGAAIVTAPARGLTLEAVGYQARKNQVVENGRLATLGDHG